MQWCDFKPSVVHVGSISIVHSSEYSCSWVAGSTLVTSYAHSLHTRFSNPSSNGPAGIATSQAPYVQFWVLLCVLSRPQITVCVPSLLQTTPV